MPPKNRTAPDAADTNTAPDDVGQDDVVNEEAESPAERRKRERAEFQARLAQLDAEDQAEGTDAPEPTHRLTLSNGDQVDVAHGGPVTHHSTPDGVFRVVGCDPLNGDR